MYSLVPGVSRPWRGALARVLAGIAMVVSAVSLVAAEPLFPQPLHLTRSIEDPIAGTSVTVEEYCAGDQVVSAAGDRVTIVDYAKQEMTEIDRAAGTWSVARFDEIARAMSLGAPPTGSADTSGIMDVVAERGWIARELPARTSTRGRPLSTFEFTRQDGGDPQVRLEVSIDRGLRLSRPAVEALIGASFPHPRRDEHAAILRAAGGGESRRVQSQTESGSSLTFGLPVEQVLSVEFEGRTLTLRNAVREIRSELPPDALRRIPPGARQVESRAVRIVREAQELDSPPVASPRRD